MLYTMEKRFLGDGNVVRKRERLIVDPDLKMESA